MVISSILAGQNLIEAALAVPDIIQEALTLFDMGGMMSPPPTPQNVFDHCVQTRKRRKLKLGDF